MNSPLLEYRPKDDFSEQKGWFSLIPPKPLVRACLVALFSQGQAPYQVRGRLDNGPGVVAFCMIPEKSDQGKGRS